MSIDSEYLNCLIARQSQAAFPHGFVRFRTTPIPTTEASPRREFIFQYEDTSCRVGCLFNRFWSDRFRAAFVPRLQIEQSENFCGIEAE